MSLKISLLIGAVAGAALVGLLGLVLGIDAQTSRHDVIVWYSLIPALVGAVLGAIIGCAFVFAMRSNVYLALSVIAWMMLLGFAGVFIPSFLMLLYNWATGIGRSGFPLRGTGPNVEPFSFEALANSLNHVLIFIVFLSLPIGIGGTVLGAIVAIIKWRVRRPANQITSADRGRGAERRG